MVQLDPERAPNEKYPVTLYKFLYTSHTVLDKLEKNHSGYNANFAQQMQLSVINICFITRMFNIMKLQMNQASTDGPKDKLYNTRSGKFVQWQFQQQH